MTISNNNFSAVIQKFIMNEIDSIIKKYAQIDSLKLQYVESLISHITESNLKHDLLKDFDKTLQLATEVGDNCVDNCVINVFLWIRNNTNLELAISEIKGYNEELQENGYTLIGDCNLLYKRDANLKDFAIDKLEIMLDDEYYIDKLLTKDELIEYWMNGTSKNEVMKELINGVEVSELLDFDSQSIFEDEYGEEYLYAEIDC